MYRQTSNKFIFTLNLQLRIVLALSFLPTLQACTSARVGADKRNERIQIRSASQRVYSFPYDSVWRACQLALKYPIAVNNIDSGILETDWIKASEGFLRPDLEREPSAGIRYKITINLVKGKLDNKESVRATLVKKIEKHRDFFAEPETLESDGLEEKVLFYRIEREILIEEGLKKAAAKVNS